MQAVTVNFAERKVELADRPEPKIESDQQVLMQILEVGVCGTDREICSFDYGRPPEGEPVLVLGHENFGRVLEVGSA
ncbi:MAG TPA: alcohol dehydrogenase catalytic domain-containing protein, partial [Limnochordia bacterium]|nr:alcohol dehydrogenase catalytic domain-containing protein [Limnochordia bacterium]